MIDVGVYDTVNDIVKGNLKVGQSKVYSLEQDGVGIPESSKSLVLQDILDYVNNIIER